MWGVQNFDTVSDDAVVEAVINNGEFEDVQQAIELFGMENVAGIFRSQISKKRHNYSPKIAHYFTLYFDKHAPRDS